MTPTENGAWHLCSSTHAPGSWHGWSVAQPHLITFEYIHRFRILWLVAAISKLRPFPNQSLLVQVQEGLFLMLLSIQILGNVPASHFDRMLRMLAVGISALARQSLTSLMSCQSIPRIWLQTYFRYLHIHTSLQQTGWSQVILRPLASQYYPSLEVCSLIKVL